MSGIVLPHHASTSTFFEIQVILQFLRSPHVPLDKVIHESGIRLRATLLAEGNVL